MNITNANTPNQVFFMDTQSLTQATGTYTMWVQDMATNFGSETLQLNSVPADFTAPITINGPTVRVPTTGNTALGQNAVLTFSGTSGQQVTVNVVNYNYASSSDCHATVWDPNGTFVTYGSCGAGGSSLGSFSLCTGSAYTITINPQGMATGNVSFHRRAIISPVILEPAPDDRIEHPRQVFDRFITALRQFPATNGVPDRLRGFVRRIGRTLTFNESRSGNKANGPLRHQFQRMAAFAELLNVRQHVSKVRLPICSLVVQNCY